MTQNHRGFRLGRIGSGPQGVLAGRSLSHAKLTVPPAEGESTGGRDLEAERHEAGSPADPEPPHAATKSKRTSTERDMA